MAEAVPAELLLASTSPFRRRLLEAAGVPFRVVPANVDEPALKRDLVAEGLPSRPEVIAQAIAAAKARAVSSAFPETLVLGGDQVLAIDDELFDKPGNLVAARAQLERLRGRTHRLFSAAALAQHGQVVWETVERATLTMRKFSRAFLEAYLAGCGSDVCGIVGAYEIEGPGIQLFERVEGDHFTIIGLPLLPLLTELRMRRVIRT